MCEIDDIDDLIKPNFKSVNATTKIDNNTNKMTYFELLTKMSKNEIDFKDMKIKDSNGIVWSYDNDGNFIRECNFGIEFLCEHYNDLEFPSLVVEILPDEPETTLKKEALKKVLSKIESLYMDLNMTIDNCQGCMDNLDLAFVELDVYRDIIEYLGGNVKANYERMVNEWFAKQRKLDEKEKARKHPIFQSTQTCILDFISDDDKVSKAIVDLVLTINDIADKLNKQQCE